MVQLSTPRALFEVLFVKLRRPLVLNYIFSFLFTVLVVHPHHDHTITTVLKVYSNELFLLQLTNDLCTSFTKIVIILFLSKAVFIKRTLLFQYFVLKIEPP